MSDSAKASSSLTNFFFKAKDSGTHYTQRRFISMQIKNKKWTMGTHLDG
jgi:hypothetical protein